MGRKSREKQLRKQQAPPKPSPGQELFADVPHERQGHFLVPLSEGPPGAPQAEATRQRPPPSLLPGLIREGAEVLGRLLSGAPSRDLLAALALEVFAADVETHAPALSGRPWIFAEFPTWFYLTSPSTNWESQEKLTQPQFREVLGSLESLVGFVEERSFHEQLLPDRKARILARARLHQLLVRQPAQLHQIRAQHAVLFGAVREPLLRLAGFDIEEAWLFFQALQRLTSRRFLARMEGRATEPWRATVEAHQLAAGDVFLVTPAQMAEVSGRPEAAAIAFLKLFSLEKRQAPMGEGLPIPMLYEALELAPLVDLGDGTWFVHLAPKLPMAFKPRLEKLLKTEDRPWKSYQRARAGYLEARSLELVSRLSPAVKSWSALEYEFDEGQGLGLQRFELDGLLVADTVLFLVEAKAGALRWAARRGAPSAMDDLEALVSDAHQQALRALKFIESAPQVRFLPKRGSPVDLSRENFTRVVLLTSTLDDLTAYVTRLRDLVEARVLQDGPLPWAVALHDLEVITELSEGVWQLVHYIERRNETESLELFAGDEIDLFAGYLAGGLRFEGAGDALVMVPDMSGGINDFYAHQTGLRRAPAGMPHQCMPVPFRQLIQALESSAPRGYIEAICALLEISPEGREPFMAEVGRRHSHAARRGFSAFFEIAGRQVIAFISSRSPSRDLLKKYTHAVKYMTRQERAVGIMQATGRPGVIDVVVELGTWREEPEMQSAAEETLRRLTV